MPRMPSLSTRYDEDLSDHIKDSISRFRSHIKNIAVSCYYNRAQRDIIDQNESVPCLLLSSLDYNHRVILINVGCWLYLPMSKTFDEDVLLSCYAVNYPSFPLKSHFIDRKSIQGILHISDHAHYERRTLING